MFLPSTPLILACLLHVWRICLGESVDAIGCTIGSATTRRGTRALYVCVCSTASGWRRDSARSDSARSIWRTCHVWVSRPLGRSHGSPETCRVWANHLYAHIRRFRACMCAVRALLSGSAILPSAFSIRSPSLPALSHSSEASASLYVRWTLPAAFHPPSTLATPLYPPDYHGASATTKRWRK